MMILGEIGETSADHKTGMRKQYFYRVNENVGKLYANHTSLKADDKGFYPVLLVMEKGNASVVVTIWAADTIQTGICRVGDRTFDTCSITWLDSTWPLSRTVPGLH